MKKTQGFTLIEVMIVVVIVAILAAVAIPSYQSHIMRTNRSDAREMLLQIAAAQEKHFFQNNSYGSLQDLGLTTLADPMKVATTGGHYEITYFPTPNGCVNDAAVNCTGYNLQATPRATSPQADDSQCSQISISHTGRKAAMKQGGSPGDATEECW